MDMSEAEEITHRARIILTLLMYRDGLHVTFPSGATLESVIENAIRDYINAAPSRSVRFWSEEFYEMEGVLLEAYEAVKAKIPSEARDAALRRTRIMYCLSL